MPLLVLWALLLSTVVLVAVNPPDADAQSIETHGPTPFVDLLDEALPTTWTPAATDALANRDHVVLLDAASQTHALAIDGTATMGLTRVAASDVDATYGSALRAMFQLLDVNTEVLATESLAGTYTIHPELLSYYAIDADAAVATASATQLALHDRASRNVPDAAIAGYLEFEFEGTPDSTTIKAVGRHVYDGVTDSFESVPLWSGDQWLVLDATGVSLSATEADATAFLVADANDLVDVTTAAGSDFNPNSIDWQTNSFAEVPVGDTWAFADSRHFGQIFTDTDSALHAQFGHSATATAAATSALDAIEAALSAEGSSLRYDKSVYLAYRENALSHTVGAFDVFNTALGERTVAHVYFVNAQADDGVSHPFMVIASHDISAGPNFLIDVARPPGDGNGGRYEDQTITRRAILEEKLVKIPLKDYGLVADVADNDLAALGIDTLAADEGLPESQWNVLNHAGNASTGTAIDGVVIYPASNNTLALAPEVAEITSTGIHVGRGLGLHYHADGHGFTGNGLNLYNIVDYPGHDHPPIIGFGYDGVALYGKYESAYSMDGSNVPLDEFGGHSHGDYGYHYHAHEGDQGSFIQHFLLVGAWKGDVNNVPGLADVGFSQLKGDNGRYAGASYDAPAAVTCNGLTVTIQWSDTAVATAGDDVIRGTAGADTIDGLGGNDTICALGGNDTVIGNDGDDTIFGGDGDDRLFGRQGVDTIWGEGGADTIHGNRGNDVLSGGDDDDRIFGYANDDTISGGAGDDRLHGNFGNDVLDGGDGDDRMFGYGDNDTLNGGIGADLIGGNFGDDIINGNDGDDTLYGSDGDDEVHGGPGNDTVEGNSLNDLVTGGAGNDALDGGIGTDECQGNSGTDTATRCETVSGVP